MSMQYHRLGRCGRVLLMLLSLQLVESAPVSAWQVDLGRPADTSSPQATLESLINSTNAVYDLILDERYFKRDLPEHRSTIRRILDCIDDRALPEYAREDRAAEAATCIKEILDRVELPPFEEIPDAETIESNPEIYDRWQIPGTRLTIVRVEEGRRKHEYLFSSGTVDRAVEHFEDIRSLPYRTTGPATSPGLYDWYVSAPANPWVGVIVDRLPETLKNRALGLAYWKWLGLGIALAVATVLLGIIYRWQTRLGRQFRDHRPVLYGLTIVFPIVAALVPLMFSYVAVNYVSLRGTWLYAVSFAANFAELVTSVILVFSLVNRIVAFVIASPRINPQGLDAQFIRIVSKILSLAISVVVFLEGGQYLGLPITTLLASAGVGGLAVALAAQDTLKNLFGTVMLMADKPFRVGDRVVVAKYDGNVEDIGLRSTRIRLLTGHQVTIPNDTLASRDVENVSRRPFIRRVANIRIPLNTSRQKIEHALAVIRAAVENHEGMSAELPPRVYLDEFNTDSFNVRVCYWFHPAEYWDYLAFSERINLSIIRAFEDEQIEFSLPLRVKHATGSEEAEPVPVRINS